MSKVFDEFNIITCEPHNDHRSRSGSNTSARSQTRSICSTSGSKNVDNSLLESNLKEAVTIVTLGLNHKTDEVAKLRSSKLDSAHHALFGVLVESLDVILQLDSEGLNTCSKKLKIAAELANKGRKKSWTKWITRPKYDDFTEDEIHAELLYADSMIIIAIVTIISEPSIKGFINAVLCARASHRSYLECYNILKYRKAWTSKCSKKHFESGVRLAIGGFDLIISYLPPKFIRLLEFAGFSGNRPQGLRQLEKSLAISDGLRWPIAVIVLSLYNLFLDLVFGLGETDVKSLESLINKATSRYPESGYFMVFRALYDLTLGNLRVAVEQFERCANKETMPMSVKNACYFFMLWAHVLLCEWRKASECAKLLQDSNWSPATSCYVRAITLAMVADEEGRDDFNDEIAELFKRVPSLKQNVGGKRAFHEQLVLKRSEACTDKPIELSLAPLEIAYVFNFLKWITGHEELISPIVARIECKLASLIKTTGDKSYYDKLAYLTFMKGICFKLSGNVTKARRLFEKVFGMRELLFSDHHLPAQAAYELGLICRSAHNYQAAADWLRRAKNDFAGNYAETVINYRSDLLLASMKGNKTKEHRSGSLIGSLLVRKYSGHANER